MNQKVPGGIAVIRIPDGNILSVVLIDKRDVNKYYWFGGPQWAYGEYEVVEYIPGKLKENWRKIELWYLRKYHKVKPSKEIKQSALWMSPTGSLYYCSSHEHDSLARRITASVYKNVDGTRYLEDNDWIRMYQSGLLASSKLDYVLLNDNQAEVISKLKQVGDDNWQSRLSDYLEHYQNNYGQ